MYVNQQFNMLLLLRRRLLLLPSSMFLAVLLLFLLLLLDTSVTGLTGDCYDGEMEVEFVLFLDEDSWTEQAWFMQCTGYDDAIWNNTVGFLEEFRPYLERRYPPRIIDQACVNENSTCVFTIEDSWGDGLLHPGQFWLTYEATTIAIYTHTIPFEELSYCFGPLCS